MTLSRRQCLILGTAAVTAACPNSAWSDTYPGRPVRLMIGYAAGGGVDIVGRLMSQSLSEQLGQQFVVENRPGAGSNIATETVVGAASDGYTLLLVSPANAINATLYDNLKFNFIRDIAPVAGIMRQSQVMLVNPLVPANTVPEFIAYARRNVGKVNVASAGIGTPSHLAAELFAMMAGVDLTHVPYRGVAPAMTDLLGGQVQVIFTSTGSSIGYIRSNALRPLAVTTLARSELLPDVPVIADFVSGYEASQWYGLGVPRRTSVTVIDRLNQAVNAALVDPKMKARMRDLGGTAIGGSPADFASLIAGETEKLAGVIKTAKIKPESHQQ